MTASRRAPSRRPCRRALTALGQERMEPIDMLAAWALRRREAVTQARAAYDAREEPPTPREPR
ncbi:hypothetical protein [Myxococcus sp. AB036A]|uniref:hypothetical protein n=1 Tax=Myxococcus sp. AB036A TaxID=2562793 RepID=UPI001E442E26|nr:hypothetical protein [Myxococcus sp. AB036A]